MFETVVSHFRGFKGDGGVEYTVCLGRTPVGLGDMVNYKYKDAVKGQKYVVFRRVVKLSDITEEDLYVLPPGLTSKNELWAKLESEYGLNIPAHYEVSILGLGDEDYYPQETIRGSHLADVNSYFDIPDEFDEFEEYEEPYENTRSSEPIKKPKNNDW